VSPSPTGAVTCERVSTFYNMTSPDDMTLSGFTRHTGTLSAKVTYAPMEGPPVRHEYCVIFKRTAVPILANTSA